MNRFLVHLYTAIAAMFALKARRRNDPRRHAVTALYRAHRREAWAKQRRRCFWWQNLCFVSTLTAFCIRIQADGRVRK